MKRILILEDNVKTLTSLEKMIREISPEIITFPVQTYEEACICAVKQQIDIFILDIILNTKQPGDTSGLAFAREMRNYKKYQLTPVIFITVLADPELYAYRELHSFGYLEKPFSMEEARKLVIKALENTVPVEKEKTIWLRKDGILFAVPLHKVICVETRNHILSIYLQDELLEIPYITIKEFMSEADGFGFFQCSRSTLVNKNHIKSVDMINRYISFRGTEKMGERLYTLMEICNIICCLHFIYNKKIKIDIQSVLLICADCILFELINIYPLERNLSMLMYFLIFLYIIIEFDTDIRSLIMGNLLYVVVLGISQILGGICIVLLRLEELNDSWMAIGINFIAFFLIVLVRKKLHRLFEHLIKKNRTVICAFVISFLVMLGGILKYKKEMETSVGQFVILLIITSLISIFAYRLQKEKEMKSRVEMELQMHKMYDDSFASLISTMRKNQHEFNNHLQAIAGMHYTLHTYEELVNEQNKYFGNIMQKNKFYRLLNCNWPVVAGFLYNKFKEADGKGINVNYKMTAEQGMCRIPEFVMVEILGILLDNAIEAAMNIENPVIYVYIVNQKGIIVEVSNPILDVTYGEIMHFFEEGYSRKDGHNGLGLYKIAEYSKQYNFEPRVIKERYENRDYLKVRIQI